MAAFSQVPMLIGYRMFQTELQGLTLTLSLAEYYKGPSNLFVAEEGECERKCKDVGIWTWCPWQKFSTFLIWWQSVSETAMNSSRKLHTFLICADNDAGFRGISVGNSYRRKYS